MAPRFRSARAVHRLDGDTLLVRVVGGDSFELRGEPAQVWLVAEAPMTADEIEDLIGATIGGDTASSPAAVRERRSRIEAAIADLVGSGVLLRDDR